ncbi:dihydropteroate synthase [Herbivorax sp. ANBcel31]|uniref:dihydropteroate synthase n=1 Tax=Herbivorax sp. ANBcel31 TaxID=3069754 RepID=UPI0027B7EEAA|nr:dihydropteroate synthase [Herbivorax sp. ANBcel31]MDQ2086381.1 dihydropteroate synthase [Herbivorax sp. ANBcel31]
MINARIVQIDNMHVSKEEIRKVGVDAASIPCLAAKALFIVMKIENISSYAANIIKQEMLGKGGDAAINRGTLDCSIKKSDVLLMGTYGQYSRLVYKLGVHRGVFTEIADEVQRVIEVLDIGKPKFFECGKYKLPIGEKTYVMGILNVTPDSFSDGGEYSNLDGAVRRAIDMVKNGADIIDVGGESTRPGYEPVDPLAEINRVAPVIEKIVKEINVPVSVDTSKALVAEKAIEAGASIVNDVWGLQKDKNMAEVISKTGSGVVMMHNSDKKEYKDLMGDIIRFLRESIEIAENAGVRRESIVIDPGIGFGKTLQHNLDVMRRLKELNSLNAPVLIGTSRKSLIGNVLELPVNERLEGTAATVTLGIANGADMVRVHDVKEIVRAARMTDAMVRI